ncbi:phage major tail tube protein [Cupriavidus sp. SW-Y-13]|uniref:phage major tail tube protein n=1 Tax=Cupriavidus sp. SW-Y-13 TaxID=2653854 RepID=UPI0013663103|nr:phage major tail tube protein [Cupriavidus sp. SW-Y-13]MWL87148.1 phage major tail tube protein [Cupriavidus sp. SW-Y-13]
MAMPKKLKNFNVFADGVSFIGEVEEFTLPKLTRKLEEYRAGGMNGPVEIDLGAEKMESEATYGGIMREIFKSWGISSVDGAMLRFAGAIQRDDSEAVDSLEVVMRGRHTELDLGNAKAGDNSQFKVKSAISYYKLSVNNEVWCEIDHNNFIEVVFGVDRLAEQRRAMGV